jgi:hypothetical protein
MNAHCQIEYISSDRDVGTLRQDCRSEVRGLRSSSARNLQIWIVAAQVKIEISGRFSIG